MLSRRAPGLGEAPPALHSPWERACEFPQTGLPQAWFARNRPHRSRESPRNSTSPNYWRSSSPPSRHATEGEVARSTPLHVSAILAADFIQSGRNLAERAVTHRVHQNLEHVAVFDDGAFQFVEPDGGLACVPLLELA